MNEVTDKVYEFTPRNATIELSGFKPEEVEKFQNKRVTIVLKNVYLKCGKFYRITPNYIDTKLEFFGGLNERSRKD